MLVIVRWSLMTTIRWSDKHNLNATSNAVDDFLLEILEVSKRHDMQICSEDHHSCFIIEKGNDNLGFLFGADIGSSIPCTLVVTDDSE